MSLRLSILFQVQIRVFSWIFFAATSWLSNSEATSACICKDLALVRDDQVLTQGVVGGALSACTGLLAEGEEVGVASVHTREEEGWLFDEEGRYMVGLGAEVPSNMVED